MQTQLILLSLFFSGRLWNPSRDFLSRGGRARICVEEVALSLQEFDQEVVLVVILVIMERDLAYLTFLLSQCSLELYLLYNIVEVLQVEAVFFWIPDAA